MSISYLTVMRYLTSQIKSTVETYRFKNFETITTYFLLFKYHHAKRITPVSYDPTNQNHETPETRKCVCSISSMRNKNKI